MTGASSPTTESIAATITVEGIERLSQAAHEAGIEFFEWADQDGTLTLRFTVAGDAGDPLVATGEPLQFHAASRQHILSPAVGFFQHRHPATNHPVVEAGTPVAIGQIVGVVQAGVMLHPVVADQAGTLGAPTCPDGAPVGYGTPLFPLT